MADTELLPAGTPAPSLIPRGTMLEGVYRVGDCIGQGAMGTVYVVEHVGLGKRFAAKVMCALTGEKPDAVLRLQNEARAASAIEHDNVVTVTHLGQTDGGSVFIVMELLEGESLRERLLRESLEGGKSWLPDEEVSTIGEQILAGLGAAHRAGIVHRDLKPENVFLARKGDREVVKLVDFGISKLRAPTDLRLTRTGQVFGTPLYMSPEQGRSAGDVDHRSDLYAAGVILYELVTGKVPFESDSVSECLVRHATELAPPPSTRRAAIPGSVEAVILRCLAKKPEDRFASADLALDAWRAAWGGRRFWSVAEFQWALDAVTKGSPIAGPTARPTPRPTPRVPAAVLSPDAVRSGSVAPAPREARMRLEVIGAPLELDTAALRMLEMQGLDVATPEPSAQGRPSVSMWHVAQSEWQGPVPAMAPHALLYLEGSHEGSRSTGALERFDDVLIGEQPIDPRAIACVVRCLTARDSVPLAPLVSAPGEGALELREYRSKERYVEELIESLTSTGVRRPARWAVQELAEELIANVFLHATASIGGDPAAPARLRWAVGPELIALAVRDEIGSLRPAEVAASFARPAGHLDVREDRRGAGLGLRIMGRAARHLIFNISPGHFCEIMALVDRVPRAESAQRRSLAVLREPPARELRVGDRLVLRELAHGRAVYLVGAIDETCQMGQIFDRSGTTWVDLGGVTSIDSRGIQKWILACRSRRPDARFLFVDCSPAIVRQLNLVACLAEGATVLSIQLPYCCPACDGETTETVKVAEVTALAAPPRRCPKCRQPMTLDGTPEEYLGFWRRSAGSS